MPLSRALGPQCCRADDSRRRGHGGTWLGVHLQGHVRGDLQRDHSRPAAVRTGIAKCASVRACVFHPSPCALPRSTQPGERPFACQIVDSTRQRLRGDPGRQDGRSDVRWRRRDDHGEGQSSQVRRVHRHERAVVAQPLHIHAAHPRCVPRGFRRWLVAANVNPEGCMHTTADMCECAQEAWGDLCCQRRD